MGDPDKELDFAIPDFLCCWLTKVLNYCIIYKKLNFLIETHG